MQEASELPEHASRSPFYAHASGSPALDGPYPPNGVGSAMPHGQQRHYAPEPARAGSASLQAGPDAPHYMYRGLSSQLSGLSLAPAGSGLSYEGESPRRVPVSVYRQRSDGFQPHPARPGYSGRSGGAGEMGGYQPRMYPGARGPYGGRGPPGMVRVR
jgi:hypothetical protein